MELGGHLDAGDKAICEKFLIPFSNKIGNELIHLPNDKAKDALTQIFNDASAIAGSVMLLCGQE